MHSHCPIAMDSNGTFLNLIPKSFKVTFIQIICAQQLLTDIYQLRRLIMQHYLASLMTMKHVIFPTIDMCSRCSSFQPCIPHNPSRSALGANRGRWLCRRAQGASRGGWLCTHAPRAKGSEPLYPGEGGGLKMALPRRGRAEIGGFAP